MSQIGPIDSSVNVQIGASSASRDVGANDTPVKPADDSLPAQYSYDTFDQVIEWIARLSNVSGHCPSHIFDGHLKLRECYLSQGETMKAKSVENLIKNHVGICRFDEETENFHQKFSGKGARFCEGKFIGWEGEVPYDPSLRGVVCYEI
jgi:hypothetical protein